VPAGAIDLVVFLELIGRDRDRIEAAIDAAQQHVSWLDGWRAGLSPHAPYTIDDDLLSQAVGIAAEQRVPLAIHIAESREELQWLRDGSGRLGELLAQRGGGMSQPAAFDSPLDLIRRLAAAPKVLLVHGNYLDGECIDFIARQLDRMSVVYCPRTHDYFGHYRYPLETMIERGVNVALGTDGRSSNPDLSLLAELRHVRKQFRHLPPRDVLRMGTLNGARALGCGDDCGTLAPGKLANLAVVCLPDREAEDPTALVLDGDLPNAATIHRGKLVYGKL
jgi:cytosine/adenosine deaminase-related metal-dependent hydrolase